MNSLPTTVSDFYQYVVGVDTHAATHSYAILAVPTGAVLDQDVFPTSQAGLRRARDWISRRTNGDLDAVLVAVEGTGSYGALLSEVLEETGYRVVEAPTARRSRGQGKTESAPEVTQAGVAFGAAHFDALQTQGSITQVTDLALGQGNRERWLPAVGVDLLGADEQILATGPALINPGGVRVEVLARVRPLGARLSEHLELLRHRFLAPLFLAPLDIGSVVVVSSVLGGFSNARPPDISRRRRRFTGPVHTMGRAQHPGQAVVLVSFSRCGLQVPPCFAGYRAQREKR